MVLYSIPGDVSFFSAREQKDNATGETKVTVISTSPNKKKEAIENLGADSFLISGQQDQLQVWVLNYIFIVWLTYEDCWVQWLISNGTMLIILGCYGYNGWNH